MSAPFESGERILLIDNKERHYLLKLQTGGTFHTHGGTLAHDDILGQEQGVQVRAEGGMVLRCFRPRLADFVLKMPRGAQVVYPKDLGQILVWADVAPGCRVLEAGTGSGALSLALCRAVGAEGRVVSYEEREEHRTQAVANIEAFHGKIPTSLELRVGDVREIATTGERFDRCVLDLPNPWELLGELSPSLDAGAIVCAYLPTVLQVQQVVLALEGASLVHQETLEVLLRTWHVTERSVRPDHRMVAHTGFLTVARKLG
ncbi:MAG: tRNA (adenine-N1)-methyltransferase [Actinomycetota bacterium]